VLVSVEVAAAWVPTCGKRKKKKDTKPKKQRPETLGKIRVRGAELGGEGVGGWWFIDFAFPFSAHLSVNGLKKELKKIARLRGGMGICGARRHFGEMRSSNSGKALHLAVYPLDRLEQERALGFCCLTRKKEYRVKVHPKKKKEPHHQGGVTRGERRSLIGSEKSTGLPLSTPADRDADFRLRLPVTLEEKELGRKKKENVSRKSKGQGIQL